MFIELIQRFEDLFSETGKLDYEGGSTGTFISLLPVVIFRKTSDIKESDIIKC